MKQENAFTAYAEVIALTLGLLIGFGAYLSRNHITKGVDILVAYRNHSLGYVQQIEPTPHPSVTPTPTVVENDTPPEALPTIIYTDENDALPWGVAEKVDDVTYTIRVGHDEQMATSQEVVEALNQYRETNGVGSLTWDDKLGSYAQVRAEYFQSIEGTDKHAGFDNYLQNEDGFNALGFRRLGENSYYGGPLTGTHLIEWVFSQSPGHNANQLDKGWQYVGVGVSSNGVNLIFGAEKM